jgi:hypothetical protein
LSPNDAAATDGKDGVIEHSLQNGTSGDMVSRPCRHQEDVMKYFAGLDVSPKEQGHLAAG